MLPLESSLSPIITKIPIIENMIRHEFDTLHRRFFRNPSSSSTSSSNPPTPPSPPIQDLGGLLQMAQPQRLLNIILFPYYYGKPGDDPDAYEDHFQIVATANELPQDKYLTSFLGNLIGNASEWYATLEPRPATWDDLRTTFLTRFWPQAFQNSLMDQLGNFHMSPYENVDAYYTRLKSLLHKWHMKSNARFFFF